MTAPLQSEYFVIGTMSGTSLDGLDICYCRFLLNENKWEYEILKAQTFEYDKEWIFRLENGATLTGLELIILNNEFARLCGELINTFVDDNQIRKIDFLSSHGHTLFHQPSNNLTFQLGAGAVLAATTGITTVSDFRSLDVALGGQGAPLVPIGDELLFSDFQYCLNIGGIANISFIKGGQRRAFDICPANIVLNLLAAEAGFKYDEDGKLAASGNVIPGLLEILNSLTYYDENYPKSLGREWVDSEFLPLVQVYEARIEDKLATICEHIAIQISNSSKEMNKSKMLLTGGGALNKFLIKRIKQRNMNLCMVPDLSTVQFKEALIFAFLGVLRWRNENNCLRSVTGAERDNSGGSIYVAPKGKI